MTKTIPNYLRLHRTANSTSGKSNTAQDSVHRFWNDYSDVTGWRIDPRAEGPSESLELLPAVGSQTTEIDASTAVSKIAATRLAESASRLAQELKRNREAMRRQEMELASRAPIMASDSERSHVADRIEQTLADAVAASRCTAAAMYLLDEETQYLKVRAVHGLPTQRLEEQARPLRGSRGDLEAMVQDVITIDDLNAVAYETWSSPEPFAAAICAQIQSDGVPIGTLWLFSNEAMSFTAAESASARLAASQIGLELTHASFGSADDRKGVHEPVRDLAQWQYESLPVGATVAEGWQVDGLIESPNDWATGWHVWDVLPDGTLMIAIAEAVEPSVKGAMSAAIARAALTSHTGYRHTVSQLIQRVSDTLWQTSTSEQLMSMFYARLDPESGDGEVVSAGSIGAMIASRYGFRPLLQNNSDPLNMHIEARPTVNSFRLLKGETLLAYSAGFGTGCQMQTKLGSTLRDAMQSSDGNPLARVRRMMAGHEFNRERGAISLLRE